MKDFTQIIEDNSMKIGYIPGSQDVLFIKCGQGGSIYGYENKYLNLAWSINKKYGYTVISSEIIDESKEFFSKEMEMIKTLVGENCKIYYLGVSKGGLLGLWNGADHQSIKKFITINAPLMLNFHNRTRPAINKISKENIVMIYGTQDPSFAYIPFIREAVNVQIVEGADHNLVGGNVKLDEIVENILTK